MAAKAAQAPVRVSLGPRSYAIRIEDSYAPLRAALDELRLSTHVVVITHAKLLRLHGDGLLKALKGGGREVRALTVPESEASKSLAVFEQVVRRMARGTRERAPLVVAFGGGVVGDLAGFAAAAYRRGVDLVQVPTTLLAQVDSAIGGKVAVDLPEGKNLIGAYHQPRLVYTNTAVLGSLPARQIRTGLAEVIKYGVIADARLFSILEKRMEACLALNPPLVREIIRRSCAIKARVVSRDERERAGLRLLLNFGHTLGHALEAAGGYERWTHGEAIAVGMAAAAWMAVELKRCPARALERIEAVIAAAGLPVRAGAQNAAALQRAIRLDKKFVSGKQRWVLPVGIGKAVVAEDVPPALIARALRRYC